MCDIFLQRDVTLVLAVTYSQWRLWRYVNGQHKDTVKEVKAALAGDLDQLVEDMNEVKAGRISADSRSGSGRSLQVPPEGYQARRSPPAQEARCFFPLGSKD